MGPKPKPNPKQISQPTPPTSVAPASQTITNDYTPINTTQKKDEAFRDCTLKLAAADAGHDFENRYVTGYKEIFSEGLPLVNAEKPLVNAEKPLVNAEKDIIKTLFSSVLDERGSLYEVMNIDKDKTGDRERRPLHKTIIKPDTPFTTNITNHAYVGKRVTFKDTDYKNATEFLQESGLTGAVLVIDFNQHGFINVFKEGPKSTDQVYYVMTSEIVNDPAPKTPLDSKLFRLESGIDLVPCMEINALTKGYTTYDQEDTSMSNNFISKYNLQLSPIKEIKKFCGMIEKMETDLNISCIGEKGAIQNNTIKNSKKENSIKTLLKYLSYFLNSVFPKIKIVKKNVDVFNYNTKLQQKRSGDWLQVLTCFDIYNRTFQDARTKTLVKFNPKANIVYFVTHDQIAAAYALLMGANVLFLDAGSGDVFVLKNTKFANVDPEAYVLQMRLSLANEKELATSNTMVTFLDEYQTMRTGLVDKYTTNMNTAIGKITTALQAVDSSIEVDEFTRFTNELFTNAVIYCYVIKSLADAEPILTLLKTPIVTEGETATLTPIETLGAIRNAYNEGKAIMNQHGKDAKYVSMFIGKITKLDVYTSAKEWSWVLKTSTRIQNFLGIGTKKIDKRLFLTYLDALPDTLKLQILVQYNLFRNFE